MKTSKSKKNDCKITFIKKLSLVTGTKQFFMSYLFPAFLIITLTSLLVISGVFAEDYLWLSVLLFLISVVITCTVIKYGVDKVWKDIFE